MPSQSHPQAQFVPISPGFNLEALVDSSNNFDFATRIPLSVLKDHPSHQFEALVLNQVIREGRPLVIEGWGENLDPSVFSRKWLEDNLGSKHEKVRDIPNGVDIPMTLGHYLRSMDQLTRMFSTSNGAYKDQRRQRLYMKDIDCPDHWANKLEEIMPACVYYLNDCIESRTGGDGAIREPNEYGQMRYGKGVAPAGDLMSSLPPDMRAMNMMCYIGHEGTYTPAHREMCASLGQNIMVETSENEKGERAGSSIWFMTETSERELVSEYFLSMLGHDIEVEKHFAQLNAWKKAPFNVWVVEQKVGDLILIPPLAPHQVWNKGTRTIKVAWNRTTVDTLELAIHEALPRARMVCRDEQYKCKAIIYYTLANYYELLQRDTIEPKMWKYGRIKQLLDDFKRLFDLYQEVLVSEMFSPKLPEETDVEMLPYDSNVTCSYCRCNIFNRFLTCKACILHGDNGVEDTYDICMDCYAMGRSCACISNLSWVEQWDWSTLVQNYETWRNIIVQSDGFFDARRSPQTIDIARKRYGKKPIAEVCQEQLKIRPWTDITKPREPTPEMSDIEPEADDEGRLKPRKGGKKVGKRRGPDRTKDKAHACHICCHHEWDWKLAFCTTCNLAYCYGTLFRAFDLMPQTVMEDKEWQCPKCLKMCSCGKCRKGNTQTPYQPKGTLLGHDTRKVADYRSVESLVDFSKTNLSWLRDENAKNPHESARMKRLKEKAEAEKARVDLVDESYLKQPSGVQDDPFLGAEGNDHAQNMADIDPELRGPAPSSNENGVYRSPYEKAHTGVNGHGADGLGDEALNAYQDGHYDLDDHDPYNDSNPRNHLSRIPSPMAPLMAPVETYPDPSHVGQTRMMGIGYYQQQGNAPDRILYDAPNEDESSENSLKQLSFSQNPNLAFSDLLDPELQADHTKKRKRHGDDDDDDVEFFTSKKQKALATKKSRRDEQDYNDYISRPEKVPPRRSIAKVKSYADLGEDAVPIEDDEGPSMLCHANHAKRKPENNDSDLEIAAKELSQLGKPKAKEKAPIKRSFRSRQENAPASTFSGVKAPNMIMTPRRSAWLARKEAEEDGSEFPAELPKRTRRRRSTGLDDPAKSASPAIEISSNHSSEDDEEEGVNFDLNSEVDSLFGEPIEKQNDDEDDITWRPSDVDPNVEVAEMNHRAGNEDIPESPVYESPMPEKQAVQILLPKARNESVVEESEKPAPKRRGRPPKKHSPSLPAAPRFDPPSPPPAMVAPGKKLLSLKEKLAAKGKSFKIVGAKTRPTSVPPSATVSSIPKSFLKTPSIPNPRVWNSVNNNIKPSFFSESGSSRTATPADTSTSKSTLAPTPNFPKSNGPTVVRLASPESELEEPESERYTSKESDADDSSSDDDIPAVQVPATKLLRGGSVSLRGLGRGRPRGKAS